MNGVMAAICKKSKQKYDSLPSRGAQWAGTFIVSKYRIEFGTKSFSRKETQLF